jgi:glutathione S-transferase
VRMAAQEKGVPYEHIPALPHSDEVKAINPLGLVPVMRHDGLDLVESHAITQYIDTAFDGPALVPTDPREAAPINRWICTVNTSVDQLFMRRYVVEYAFHKDGHLGGDAFSTADCFLMPILAAVQNFPEGKENFEKCPNLQAYFAKVSERLSFAETAA